MVVFFLHGGGYTQPCTIEHMHYFHRLVTDINNLSNGTPNISVLLLAYNLAPEAQFPTQLKQAANVLSYLLNEGGRSPRNIIITGDSAGGGLVLSLLSHLLHPHLSIPKITLSLCKKCRERHLVPDMLRRWAGMYLGTANGKTDPGAITDGNNYSEPLLTNPSWWEGMQNVVAGVWIWGGENEGFIDSLHAFGKKFREGWKAGGGKEEGVKLEFVEEAAHIGPIMDVMLGYKEKSKTQLGLEEWLKKCLAERSS